MAVSVLYAGLKRLQVNFADGLLGCPGAQHAAAVGFLVVQGKVLHEGIHTLFLATHDCVGSHCAGKHAVLRVILKVTAGKCRAVNVHSRCIPAGNAHIVCHLADGFAEGIGQIGVPGCCDHHSGREADGALLGKVVVDGGRAVTVDGLNLTHGGNGNGLVAAQGDQAVHISNSQLVQEAVPLFVVVCHANHVSQLDAVLCAGGRGHIVRVVKVVRVVVGVVVERSLCFGRHGVICGGSGSFGIVCKAVCAGQVGHIALGKVKFVGGNGLVAGAGVGLVVNNVRCDRISLGIDHIVGIAVDADDVIALFQHIAALAVCIVRGHIFRLEGDLNIFRSTCGDLAGLCKADQVCRGFFNAAIGIRRVVVNFHNILAGHAAGVGDRHINRDGAIALGNAVQRLGKAGVGQAVAEGVNNRLVVIDQALCRSGLIELVANVDIFNVVDKSGGNLGTKGICLELVHVVIQHVAEVVPGRGGGQVIHKGINGAAGGVHIAAQHGAQGVEAALAGACAPDHALDLAVILDPAKFHGVCAVVNNNNIVKVLADEIYHVLFRLGKLQVMLARLKVIVAVAGIIGNGAHIGGQVSAFAANAGDHDHCRVRECLCIVDQVIAVLGCFRFRQGPVLCKHANLRAVCTVSSIKITQFGVQLKACIRQALQQRNRGVSI